MLHNGCQVSITKFRDECCTPRTTVSLHFRIHSSSYTFGRIHSAVRHSYTTEAECRPKPHFGRHSAPKPNFGRSLVLSQYTRLTDGRIDRRTELRQQYRALHYMQSHGKKPRHLQTHLAMLVAIETSAHLFSGGKSTRKPIIRFYFRMNLQLTTVLSN